MQKSESLVGTGWNYVEIVFVLAQKLFGSNQIILKVYNNLSGDIDGYDELCKFNLVTPVTVVGKYGIPVFDQDSPDIYD